MAEQNSETKTQASPAESLLEEIGSAPDHTTCTGILASVPQLYAENKLSSPETFQVLKAISDKCVKGGSGFGVDSLYTAREARGYAFELAIAMRK